MTFVARAGVEADFCRTAARFLCISLAAPIGFVLYQRAGGDARPEAAPGARVLPARLDANLSAADASTGNARTPSLPKR